jgi:hypothetical protein
VEVGGSIYLPLCWESGNTYIYLFLLNGYPMLKQPEKSDLSSNLPCVIRGVASILHMRCDISLDLGMLFVNCSPLGYLAITLSFI